MQHFTTSATGYENSFARLHHFNESLLKAYVNFQRTCISTDPPTYSLMNGKWASTLAHDITSSQILTSFSSQRPPRQHLRQAHLNLPFSVVRPRFYFVRHFRQNWIDTSKTCIMQSLPAPYSSMRHASITLVVKPGVVL